MVRMQIQFTEEQARALRVEASQRQVSISSIVREAVEHPLRQLAPSATHEERVRRAMAACGQFRSGLGDVAARHDDYFADSIEW